MLVLFEGSDIIGMLLLEVVSVWGMLIVFVVVGGGDNVVGVVGVGMIDVGQVMFLFGILGVYFVVSDGFLSKLESVVYSFCYVLLECWYLMFVMLSVVFCLDWVVKFIGQENVLVLIVVVQQVDEYVDLIWFLLYLFGECMLYNNLQVKGVFFGLIYQYGLVELVWVVLEGVGYVLVDGMDVVYVCGVKFVSVMFIGGGVCSEYWCQMLFDISGLQFDYCIGGDVGLVLGVVCLV